MEDYFLFLIKKIRSHRHDQEILVKSHPKDLYHASKLQHLFKDMRMFILSLKENWQIILKMQIL